MGNKQHGAFDNCQPASAMTTVKDDFAMTEFLAAFDDSELSDAYKNKQRLHDLRSVAVDLVISGQATVSEVAKLIGTSRQNVQNWCKDHPAILKPCLDKDGKPMRGMGGQPMTYDDITSARRRYLDALWSSAVERHHQEVAEREQAERERRAALWAGDDIAA